jgi:hypothetical protein
MLSVEQISDPVSTPYPIIWERIAPQGNRQTLIYDDEAIRIGNIAVRFHSGELDGERGGSFKSVEVEPDGAIAVSTGWLGTEHRTGRFIEIVADGDTPEQARMRCSAITALLALVLGNSVLGEVIFDEDYSARPNELQAAFVDIPDYSTVPINVGKQHSDALNSAMNLFLEVDRHSKAVQLSLHWCERGFRSTDPVDQLICYFVAMESILGSFAAGSSIKSYRNQYLEELKDLLSDRFDESTRNKLCDSLVNVSIRDRFSEYVTAKRIDEKWLAIFSNLATVRSKALHGSSSEVTADMALSARQLIILMLKVETKIDVSVPWEQGPLVLGARFHYHLKNYGRQTSSSE